MGAERHDSKAGLLQLFGWNAKSRKKLFSTKSSVSELSKQKKRGDGSLPMTLVDEDDVLTGSSLKGSSDFSSASSVTDEEFGVPRGPGIVARLMGLDSLSTHDVLDTHSTTYFDTQSLQDLHFQPKKLEKQQDYHLISSGNLHVKMEAPIRNAMKQKHKRSSNMPIKKFQTEVLPPKSAKPIPVTHHKLLSPIKSAKYIPPDAARIIRPRLQATTKAKVPVLASSVPLQVKDRKEKVEAVQKPWKLSETSQRPHDSNSLNKFKGESMSKSWNGSTDTTSVKGSVDSGECSTSTKGIGKSISLALQAKANVQKRKGLSLNGTKTSVVQEHNQIVSSELFKAQLGTPKGKKTKSSSLGSSNVLRQNNQKQNSYGDSGKLSSKQSIAHSQCWKPVNGDSSVARYTCSTKSADYKVVRRSISEVIDGRNEDTHSNTRTTSHKKRSIQRNLHVDQAVNHENLLINKNEQPIQSQPNKRQGTEVVSFTFTSPMMRPNRSPEFLVVGGNAVGGDALRTLLDQKLRELTHELTSVDKVGKGETSRSSSHARETKLRQTNEVASRFNSVFLSDDYQSFVMKCKIQGLNQEVKKYDLNDIDAKTVLEYRTPSPVSVLEHSFLTESCNSSDTADSSIAGDSKQSSFVQAQEALSPSTRFIPLEADVEVLHSFSSLSTPGFSAKQVLTSTSSDPSSSTQLELEYVKKVVCDIGQMFENFAVGKTTRIINSQLVIQLECQNDFRKRHLPMSRRKLLFDCVAECLDNKIQRHIGGGYKAWVEGLALVKHKERLAEDIFKDISGLSATGDCMVDELVYKDMSYKHGRWLDFEIESFELGIEVGDRMLNMLLDEVIADIL